MMYAGDELYGDDITSGLDPMWPLDDACPDCGADPCQPCDPTCPSLEGDDQR